MTRELRLSLPVFFLPGTKANVSKPWTRAVSCRFIPTFSRSSLGQPLFWSGSHLQALNAVLDVM